MRNDLQIKATWVVNDKNINEIYFDYLNKEGNYVGNIIVGEDGSLEWSIIDATYQYDIFNTVCIINGKETINRLEYKENDLDVLRWNRVKILIKNRNLILNRSNMDKSSKEERTIIR